MAGQHVRALLPRSVEQGVQVGGELDAVLGSRVVAPALAGPVVDADPGRLADGGRDPGPARGTFAQPAGQDHRGAARAGALQVHAVAADVDQPPRGRLCRAVRCLSHRLQTAADGDQGEHGEHGVQQPHTRPAAQCAAGLNDHPHHEGEQCRWPHPCQQVQDVAARGEHQEGGAQQGHRRGRHQRPPLRLLSPPGQQPQQAPSDREPQQSGPRDGGLGRREPLRPDDEEDQHEGGDKPTDQRDGDGSTNTGAARACAGDFWRRCLSVDRSRWSRHVTHLVAVSMPRRK